MIKFNKKLILSLLLISSVLILFQNCSSFDNASDAELGLPSVLGCETHTQESFFKNSYPFFINNSCVGCHDSSSSNPFASLDKAIAYNAFKKIGFNRIDQVLAAGHKGNDYSSLKPQLDNIEKTNELYEEKYDSCLNESEAGSDLVLSKTTSSQKLTFFSDKKSKLCRLDNHLNEDVTEPISLEWDLEKDFGEEYKGVKVSMEIALETYSFVCTDPEICEEMFYCVENFYVRNPKITTGDQKIELKNLNILADGEDFSLTTFSHIDTIINENSESYNLVPSGSAGLIEANGDVVFSNETSWQLKFQKLINKSTL